ncbi:hypothetical protein LTR22_022441 [Elasticomyces elasticus]|nr:hypothetical protein LTR22_022441 [Elasticomyces elasticus]
MAASAFTASASATSLFSTIPIDPQYGHLSVVPPELRLRISEQAAIDESDITVIVSEDELELILHNNSTAPGLREVSSSMRNGVLHTNRLVYALVVLHYQGPRELIPCGWIPTLARQSLDIFTSLGSGSTVAVAEISVKADWVHATTSDRTVEYTRIVPRDMLGIWFDVLATAQVKDHVNFINDLTHRLTHPSTTIQWVRKLGGRDPPGLVVSPQPSMLDWVQGQVRRCTYLLRELNYRARFKPENTPLLEVGNVEFTQRHCRLCFDLISFFDFLTAHFATTPALQPAIEATTLLALATAYSLDDMDVLDHSTVVANARPDSSDECILEFCPCHITNALNLKWRSDTNPVDYGSFGWIWHAIATQITFQHALSCVDDKELDLPGLYDEGKRLLDANYGGLRKLASPLSSRGSWDKISRLSRARSRPHHQQCKMSTVVTRSGCACVAASIRER